ncbi:MAG: thiamine biosynthesis protein [Candidatus Krumholzibacteriota bacterium]|nr:thiamine biosynthesis protein [Candidatus Krumholzibacteriota bacterium]
MRTVRAIGMVSGGLDSMLAVALVRRQDIEVRGLSCYVGFSQSVFRWLVDGAGSLREYLDNRERELTAALGIPVECVDLSTEYLELLLDPPHGYGANVNPCIDCRIFMLRLARRRMEETGADFVFTGEVLGQRPMSQHRQAMETVEQESGLEGRLLRPLCAKLLEPTIPEKEGLVDRERLLDIRGRSRRRQMQLAEELEIGPYASPAGGCALTDIPYAVKFRDLVGRRRPAAITREEAVLLSTGRHFRISPDARIVVGRDKRENEYLEREWSGEWLAVTVSAPGPTTVILGDPDEKELETAARITARYGDGRRNPPVTIALRRNGTEQTVEVVPADDEEIDGYRLSGS